MERREFQLVMSFEYTYRSMELRISQKDYIHLLESLMQRGICLLNTFCLGCQKLEL